MGELTVEGVESSKEANGQAVSVCPVHVTHTKRTSVEADDELVFPKHKRVVAAYAKNMSGATELHLYYGEQDIVFDEPELFAFGEGLAKQSALHRQDCCHMGTGL